MFLFNKKLGKQQNEHKEDVLALLIANRIIKIQDSIANYLNLKTAHFSQKQKKGILIGFCAVFGGISLYIILTSIN